MNESSKTLSQILYAALLVFSLVLAYLRLGYLPWFGVILGAIGLGLTFKMNSKQAMLSFLAVAVGFGLSWLGSSYYVYYQWESAEVVDITLGPDVSIRTWVMDDDQSQPEQQIVIYEAPPEHQPLLEEIETVNVIREGDSYQAKIKAVLATDLTAAEFDRVFALYLEKYEAQSFATDIYYLSIGPKRGSELYILYLLEQQG